MTINEWLNGDRRDKNYPELREMVVCNDGYTISIQASKRHYCRPRIDNAEAYETVELGFPSDPDRLINEYAEDPRDYRGSVYGFVPVEIVDELLEKHGGIANI